MELSRDEIVRYSRQMILAEVGGIGQARLRESRAHAGGELEALYLAGAGVGTIEVESETIARAVRALNPNVTVLIRGAPAHVCEREQCERALAFLKEQLEL